MVKKINLLLALAALLTLAACRQDMQDEPKYLPFRGSELFPDSLSSRTLVDGTIPRGFLRLNQTDFEGKAPAGASSDSSGGQAMATKFPFVVTKEIIDRGQERFNIYCAPCHGLLGDGDGMIALRGFRHPPSYHTERLREAPVGHFIDVMTNGFGVMPDYASQVPIHERWEIAAYIRALQLSQNANIAQLPPQDQAKLK